MSIKDTEKTIEYLKSEMEIQPAQLTDKLIGFIKDNCKKLNRNGVILGLSGGLDSAVVAALCARAVGADNVLVLMMPEKDSAKVHLDDANELAKSLRIRTKLINISPLLKKTGMYRVLPIHAISKGFEKTLFNKANDFLKEKTGRSYFMETLENSESALTGSILNRSFVYFRTKHRMRMLILYLYGELENRLIVGAANKSEYEIGFFVKHGIDSATDIMPIMGLYKTQVRALAKYLMIPRNIIEKQPSPDILLGVYDENVIGISYEKLDYILLALKKNWTDFEIVKALEGMEITLADIAYVKKLMAKSAHMRTVYVPN